MISPETLSNGDFTLRPLTTEDFQEVYLAASDPEIWEQHPDKLRYSPYAFTKYFRKLVGSDLPYVIIDTTQQKVVGACCFYNFNPENKSVYLGYTFLEKAYWGTGANAQIKEMLLNHAFNFLDEVCFEVAESNLRSKRALEKIKAKQIDRQEKESDEIKLLFSIKK